jgi:hypothetical protein
VTGTGATPAREPVAACLVGRLLANRFPGLEVVELGQEILWFDGPTGEQALDWLRTACLVAHWDAVSTSEPEAKVHLTRRVRPRTAALFLLQGGTCPGDGLLAEVTFPERGLSATDDVEQVAAVLITDEMENAGWLDGLFAGFAARDAVARLGGLEEIRAVASSVLHDRAG